MTKLTPHFSLEEFCASQTAARLSIDNDLPLELREAAIKTCLGLEQVRVILNAHTIHVSSGYRCKAVNDALGSKDTSQHRTAEAVDFTCPTFASPRRIVQVLRDSELMFDQLIAEYGAWVHISFTDTPRRAVLVVPIHALMEVTLAALAVMCQQQAPQEIHPQATTLRLGVGVALAAMLLGETQALLGRRAGVLLQGP